MREIDLVIEFKNFSEYQPMYSVKGNKILKQFSGCNWSITINILITKLFLRILK